MQLVYCTCVCVCVCVYVFWTLSVCFKLRWTAFGFHFHSASTSSAKIARSCTLAFECTLARSPSRSPALPPSPFLVRCGAIKTEIILCKMFCVLLPLLGPRLSPPLLSPLCLSAIFAPRELCWLGPDRSHESRSRHWSLSSLAFAVVRIRFATFRRSFQFQFLSKQKNIEFNFFTC